MIPFPDKKYQIIYADPAWEYNFGKTSSRFVNNKYSVMTKEDICKLPVNEIADNNAVLLLWITFPKLDWAFEVIKHWGFQYKTVAFSWVKTYKNNNIFVGMGYYTRSNVEICLLATKGKPLKRLSHSISSVVISQIREHSRKPDEVRDLIIKLFGDLPRIELFARERVLGWDCWGNEVDNG